MKIQTRINIFADIKKTFLSDVDISNTNIDSLTQLDMPVAIRYDLSFKPEGDIIYFNPMFPDAITENPFSAVERLYPVEMPSCTDESFVSTWKCHWVIKWMNCQSRNGSRSTITTVCSNTHSTNRGPHPATL
jgi:hypothetical protein